MKLLLVSGDGEEAVDNLVVQPVEFITEVLRGRLVVGQVQAEDSVEADLRRSIRETVGDEMNAWPIPGSVAFTMPYGVHRDGQILV